MIFRLEKTTHNTRSKIPTHKYAAEVRKWSLQKTKDNKNEGRNKKNLQNYLESDGARPSWHLLRILSGVHLKER